MTFPQASSERDSHTRWLKIAAAFWLLLISAVALIDSVGLSRLAEQTQGSAQDAQVRALGLRVADLERQTEAHERRPAPISQAEFATARQALDERMTRLEEAAETRALAVDLQTLQARVNGIETRLEKARQVASVARPRAPVATKPEVPEPPFRVLGVELRGGERFLSITSTAAALLAGARLLRAGDAEGGWQLQSIEAQAGVFQVNGQTQRVAVP
ncbi:hypothetical protein GRH76_28940 [Pseudomonas aeruginosa]|jgi:hypothetical protein|uniref:Uncharacterized protein n=1 Tax=Stutzerimonas degradans TaxID=2968968 RepID=A0A210XP22_9GAMM|nr:MULTISPECIES: hypothetical protein [Pseudomonadaceae]AWL00816.1 hypothetical protein C6Y50_12910 [Stutzerimonas stutzeri]MCQ4274606.1 hypothetical protein [Stutzerimonas degradans]MDK7794311.1 hypothetical protein [Pseudomonas aeruginosa]MWW02049.1 hypothetical protein [Pseudomonas aeruginosa]MWW42004.1 hypothetical protein [Pseudomonas aeruginosa]